MSTEYKITPRNLGSLELPDACVKDFWYLSKMSYRALFNNFGAALFNDCQKMQEAMLGYYLEKDGCLPKQFAPFCDVKARVDVSKDWRTFGYRHKSGVWLYGSSDEVLRRADDSIVIWDHKTAHPKGEQATDRFRPQYSIQVTGYGLIAEVGLKLGRVSGGALGYWDLQHQAVIDNPAKLIRDGMLWGPSCPRYTPLISTIRASTLFLRKLSRSGIRRRRLKAGPTVRTAKSLRHCLRSNPTSRAS